ncbi:MAG: hypothetical protein OJF47_000361 [Nitrospira sp.]|jgi:hypothetical protein|nr:MAG: hypothetical protein OJF47_000361 [Nitrospira sp.]
MSLTKKQSDALISVIKDRFEKSMERHKGVEWSYVQSRITSNSWNFRSLHEMEATGGEPDVIGQDKKTRQVIFCDCSAESPGGRRSLCFDREALDSRKENKPAGNAIEMAAAMRVELLIEAQYRDLQKLGCFDVKTSS